jgi:endo-1,4-beta-xylanase
MKTSHSYLLAFLFGTVLLNACSKSDSPDNPTPPPPVTPVDTVVTLKGAATFPLGFGIDYNPFMNDPSYKATVMREGDNVTFGYDMKHGAIVRNDGSFDFTRADALFNAASNAGLQVFGHTLVWHQNQNATYLNSLGTSSVAGPSVLVNGDFEAGSGNDFINWSKYNGGTSITAGSGAGEVHAGARSFKATVAANGNAWSVQLASDLFNTTTGTSYRLSFWIKAAAAGGKMRVSTGPTASYSPDFVPTTDWTLVEWTFVAKEDQSRILFDVGSTANTYFIDDVAVQRITSTGGGVTAEVIAKVDTAMSRFIRASMTRYAGKVKAWDVVNEPMADGTGALRNEANTNTSSGATDYFMWTKYLGRDYALKAFQYARAADPNALLFINDYNLESNTPKLDSLIAYVTYLKSKGAPIDGIGTQMHMSITTSQAAISEMFRKLAATGLKVRVSELDIRVNPTDLQGFTPSSTVWTQQADMYAFVVRSYMQNVPEAQRHGLTIWGVTDADSWIVGYQKKNDFPLLFNSDYTKKTAFASTLNALKGK